MSNPVSVIDIILCMKRIPTQSLRFHNVSRIDTSGGGVNFGALFH